MKSKRADVADLERALNRARAPVKEAASILWPGWRVAATPVVMIDAEGRRWLFNGRGSPRESRTGSEADRMNKGTSRKRRRPLFRAAARLQNGRAQLEIAAPEVARFPYKSWQSVYAHEAFHCYQLTHTAWLRWFRKAREGSPALKRLESLYQHRSWLRTDIDNQLQTMRRLLSSRDASPCALAELQALPRQHRERLGRISQRLCEAEQAAELIEGAARFVELALERYSVQNVRRASAPRLSATGKGARRDRGLSVANGRYYYATGYGLMQLYEKRGGPWRQRILAKGVDSVLDDLVAASRDERRSS